MFVVNVLIIHIVIIVICCDSGGEFQTALNTEIFFAVLSQFMPVSVK